MLSNREYTPYPIIEIFPLIIEITTSLTYACAREALTFFNNEASENNLWHNLFRGKLCH